MHELVAANGDAHVRGASAQGPEEHQIARLHVVHSDPPAGAVLIADLAWQCRTVQSEDVLDETAAVETRWIRTTVHVGDAAKGERRGDDL